jgi:cation:H+ antiporter
LDYLFPFVLFSIGFLMIIKGSDIFIDSVIWFTKITKIPDIIIGATLVSLGTTLPELMVSASAAIHGNTEIAIGNALGSIICNTGLILAIIIIISRPKFTNKKEFQQNGILLMLLLLLLTFVSFVYGEISRFTGVILLGILVWYLYRNVRKSISKNKTIQNEDNKEKIVNTKKIISNSVMFIIGLILTLFGSRLLITNGEQIAILLRVPDVIIGLTMTAFGTSLPELMTSITSLRKKAYDISIGNILGANILNVILVIAVSSTILPIPINGNILHLHLPFVLLIVSVTLLFSFMCKNIFRRRCGFIMVFAYINYLLFTFDLF